MTVKSTNPKSPPADEVMSRRNIQLLFLALIVTMLLAALNQTVLSAAIPTLVGELNGVEHMAWVITAYILAATIVMPAYGKISDLIGRKPMLLVAISLFMAGSVVGGLALDMNMLIVARVLQGLGGGGLMILAQAAIADVIPARERGKYMGIMGGVFAVASVAGPLLGGWLTEEPGWRWAFWMNLPLGLLALLATIFLMRLPRFQTGRRRNDYLGMALLAVGTTAIVLVATWGGTEYPWASAEIIGLAVTGVVAAGLFVLVESRAAEPIVPLSLFRDRNFNVATLAGLLTSIAMFGVLGYMPTYLQMATGASATLAGLLMIPMMGAMLGTSILTGFEVSRTGRYRMLPILGSLVMAVGLWLMSTIHAGMPTVLICLYLGLVGAGLGASMQILILVVQNSFPATMVGTATAANNFFRQVGATLGSAVVGSVFATRLVQLVSANLPDGATIPGGPNALTPDVVAALPDRVLQVVVESYDQALIPLFLWMVPLALAAALVLCFLQHKPLATRVERDIPAESLAEGQLLSMDSVEEPPRAANER